jgi:hypothetical protein
MHVLAVAPRGSACRLCYLRQRELNRAKLTSIALPRGARWATPANFQALSGNGAGRQEMPCAQSTLDVVDALEWHWKRRFLFRTPPFDMLLFQWRLLRDC